MKICNSSLIGWCEVFSCCSPQFWGNISPIIIFYLLSRADRLSSLFSPFPVCLRCVCGQVLICICICQLSHSFDENPSVTPVRPLQQIIFIPHALLRVSLFHPIGHFSTLLSVFYEFSRWWSLEGGQQSHEVEGWLTQAHLGHTSL